LKITRTTERIIIENERRIIERIIEVREERPLLSVSVVGLILGGIKSYLGL